jgi:hypothetical protein
MWVAALAPAVTNASHTNSPRRLGALEGKRTGHPRGPPGPRPFTTATSLNNLAVVLLGQGDPAGARQHLERAWPSARPAWAPTTPRPCEVASEFAAVVVALDNRQ